MSDEHRVAQPDEPNPLAPVLADTIRDLAAARADRDAMRDELTSYRELAQAATGQLADALKVVTRLRETCQRQSDFIRRHLDVDRLAA